MGQGADADDTAKLRRVQERRETEELQRVEESGEPAEARQHERRSDKAAYLKEKLAERERSEREG
jgi:hypothetical protein